MNRIQILGAIARERQREETLFPDQRCTPPEWISLITEELGEAAGEANKLYWGLMDPQINQAAIRDDMITELIQVAALCVRTIEDIEATYGERSPELTFSDVMPGCVESDDAGHTRVRQ